MVATGLREITLGHPMAKTRVTRGGREHDQSELPLNGKCYTASSEISRVCDDHTDSLFVDESLLRFPQIIEVEPRRQYLYQECPAASE